MNRRQPLPRCWLMTDERLGDGLWAALRRLPAGSGVVFRHHATPPPARRALFEQVRTVARARRLVLVLAGPPRHARAWRADGAHGRHPHHTPGLLRTAPVHDAREMASAGSADLLFVSPVFPTRSHPGAATLGQSGLRRLMARARVPVIALGGMTPARWRTTDTYGWAAIDAWASVGVDSRVAGRNRSV